MKTKYCLLFSNQTENKSNYYFLVRETKMYVFLQKTNEPHIYRVHKKTLSVKGIKEGKEGYQWDVPKASILKKIEII